MSGLNWMLSEDLSRSFEVLCWHPFLLSHLAWAEKNSMKLNFVIMLSGCNGYETGVERCQWGRRKMGSGVCDHHPNLGLRCQPFHHPESKSAQGHWRGLKFESAPHRKDLTAENTQYVSSSLSVLRWEKFLHSYPNYKLLVNLIFSTVQRCRMVLKKYLAPTGVNQPCQILMLNPRRARSLEKSLQDRVH